MEGVCVCGHSIGCYSRHLCPSRWSEQGRRMEFVEFFFERWVRSIFGSRLMNFIRLIKRRARHCGCGVRCSESGDRRELIRCLLSPQPHKVLFSLSLLLHALVAPPLALLSVADECGGRWQADSHSVQGNQRCALSLRRVCLCVCKMLPYYF